MSQDRTDKILWCLPEFFSTRKKAGLLFSSTEDGCNVLRDPRIWWGKPKEEIYDLRRELVWGILPPYDAPPEKLPENYMITLLSTGPLKAACTFEKLQRIPYSRRLPVAGFEGKLLDLGILNDYSTNKHVERITKQDLRASKGIVELYKRGMDTYRISGLLSTGMLGTQERRRTIPTKNALVVTNNTLANHLLSDITEYPFIDSFETYYCSYLGTTYAVLIMPGSWEHEQIRSVYSEGRWRVESQGEAIGERPIFPGRIGGSYFFGRFAVAEFFHRRQKQGKALLFREIGLRESVAAGAWQVLESLRHAFEEKPKIYESCTDSLKNILKNLSMSSELWSQNSKLLSGNQTTLDAFC